MRQWISARIARVCGLLLFLLVWGGISRVHAHPANIPAATARVSADGTYEVRIHFDVLAYLLEETPVRISDGPMNALLDGPADTLQTRLTDAAKRFREETTITTDAGNAAIDTLEFPALAEIVARRDLGPSRLPVMASATVRGHLPSGAKTIAFHFSDLLGTVVLTTELPYREPVSEPLDEGGTSTPLPLPTAAELTQAKAAMLAPRAKVAPVASPAPAAKPSPVAVAVAVSKAPMAKPAAIAPSPKASPSPSPQSSPSASPAAKPSPSPSPSLVQAAASPSPFPSPSGIGIMATQDVPPAPLVLPSAPPPMPTIPWYVVIGRFVKMGYLHILPEGLDHILFVLGLFLLSTRMKPLVTQITAFTLAHSLTLALALYGIVRLPSSIVEPLIAASIAFVAVENLFVTEMKAWRIAVVFGFGLIHGLGFAGALQDLGLQKRDLLTALIGFNGGVELGQLSVVAAALLTLGWFRSKPWYRQRVVVPGSILIALVAVFWLIQRLHG